MHLNKGNIIVRPHDKIYSYRMHHINSRLIKFGYCISQRWQIDFPFIFVGLLIITCNFMSLRTAWAISANPNPIILNQPDGTKITLHIRGDEYFHWFEDLDGYTVVRKNGQYAYARLNARNELVSTGLLVGRASPQQHGLSKHILPPPATLNRLRSEALPSASAPLSAEIDEEPSTIPPIGTIKNLVILCKFSDHTFGVHTRPEADFDVMFNTIGGDPIIAPTGSVKDFFYENSYGQMTLESTVVTWITLPHPESYYANGTSGMGGNYPANPQGMVEDALNLADPLVDFGQFDENNDGYVDAITIIHSGYGAESGGGSGYWIWSHFWSLWALPYGKWISDDVNTAGVNVKVYNYHTEPALWGTSGTDITRIAVICHETGHFFGLPDFYDIDGGGEGIGSWGIMGNGWGFDFSQLYPPYFSAYSKIFLGWIYPITIENTGVYYVDQAETSPVVYRINTGYPNNEYLLIENRQPVGFESDMPQGGLVIWHIDKNKADNTEQGYPGQPGWPEKNRHYIVALLQADGNYDVYHLNGISAINADTVPNTNSYQNGIIFPTYHSISSISQAGPSMSFEFDTIVPPTCDIIYTADFESGLEGFIIDNSYGDGSGLWNLATNCSSNNPGHSTPHSLYYGITSLCNYDGGQTEGVVTSPVISLAGVSAPVELRFKYFLESEGAPSQYDMASVEISENGDEFETIAHNNTRVGQFTLADPSIDWKEAFIDLSSKAGSNIRLRFHFMSIDDLENHFAGYYIDDISICGYDNFPPTLTGAVSRKTHETAGIFDLNLTLDPPSEAEIEGRLNGPTEIILSFSEPIQPIDDTPDCSEVIVSNATCQSVVFNDNTMTVSLDNITPNSCLSVAAVGIEDIYENELDGDNDVHVRVVCGEVDKKEPVNIFDLTTIKEHLFDTLSSENCLYDVNIDGEINIFDLTTVKDNLYSFSTCP